MKRIAITGGIGSGKSTVVKLFNELGIPSIDADQIARHLRQPGQKAHADILSLFGTADPMELRKILSSDPESKKDLEKIMHPLIKSASEDEFKRIEATSSAPFVLYEAALIIEAGRSRDFDALIVVTAPEKLKIERIQARDHSTPEAARAMISAQLSDQDRIQHAQYVIDNSGNLDQLRQGVRKLLDQLKQL